MNSRFAPWIVLKDIVVKKVYGFFVWPCSYHSLGDLSTSLEMTLLSQLFFTRKDDLSRRFFGFFKPSEWHASLRSEWQDCARDDVFFGGIVISTKHSAWRNPLRRSSGYAMKSVLDGWNPLSKVKFALQVKFSYGKWSLSMTSEVSPEVKLRWEKRTVFFATVRTIN